ncbi:MAG: GAF domain-containing protein [Gammaproteobacteria bacterium]|nr:GAF domain-containing protein [Gammaproteobacteria bacterium]
MLEAPIPADESQRLQALTELELLDTPADPYLQRLVGFAAQLFEVPTVLLSLVDSERQWFKVRHGLDAAETPRNISFCGHAIHGREPFVVEDASRDPRFADNPLVSGALHLRFYAGMTLRPQGIRAIGTLCLIGYQPRLFSERDGQLLRELAGLVEGYLRLDGSRNQARELRRAAGREQRKALLDPVTQLWNLDGYYQFAPRLILRASDSKCCWGVVYGRLLLVPGGPATPRQLWEVARRIMAVVGTQDLVVRAECDAFIIAALVVDYEALRRLAERIALAVAATPLPGEGQPQHGRLATVVAMAEPLDKVEVVLERALLNCGQGCGC